MNATSIQTTARLATLEEVIKFLANHMTPVPSKESLRALFDDARIPRFKANMLARRGGGPVYYSLPAIEKLLRNRTVPCRMPSVSARGPAMA